VGRCSVQDRSEDREGITKREDKDRSKSSPTDTPTKPSEFDVVQMIEREKRALYKNFPRGYDRKRFAEGSLDDNYE